MENTMKDLPLECRPREKLHSHGVGALSDAEILAIVLRTGIKGKNVLHLASDMLQEFGSLAQLLHADLAALNRIKGLGKAKSAELLAILEMARRSLKQGLEKNPVMDNPQTVADFLSLQLSRKPYEVFAALFLNSQNELIRYEELFRGTVNQTSVYPREMVLRCVQLSASSVILAHNHPSGSLQASRADIQLTQNLKAALALIDVRVLDHIIVSHAGHSSMVSLGLL
jgi:DNA repair protein RadC